MSDFRLHAWNAKTDKLHHIPTFLLRGRTHNPIKNNNLTEKKKKKESHVVYQRNSQPQGYWGKISKEKLSSKEKVCAKLRPFL